MNKLACILAGFLLTAMPLSAAQTGAEVLKLVLETRYEEARIAGLARIVAKPDDVDAYLGLALSLIELERYADADNYARKGYAVRKDPRLAEASGEASYYLGNNEAALRGLQEFIGAFPVIESCLFHRVAGIAQVCKAGAFDHTAVCYIKAGYNTFS